LIRHRPAGVAVDATVRLTFQPAPNQPPSVLGVGELLEVVRAIHKLLTTGRAMEPGDLSSPDQAEMSSPQPDAKGRADAAVAELQLLDTKLQNLLKASDTASAEALRAALMEASRFGVVGAVPAAAAGEGV
jgi:hypothetical protein